MAICSPVHTPRNLVHRLIILPEQKQRRSTNEPLVRSYKQRMSQQHDCFSRYGALSSHNSDSTTTIILSPDSRSSRHLSHEGSSRRCMHPSVSFSSVSVRVHGRVLITEHPECADGIALGLDWKHARKDAIMDINQYEQRKASVETKTEFRKLSTREKRKLLTKVCGYNAKDFWRI